MKGKTMWTFYITWFCCLTKSNKMGAVFVNELNCLIWFKSCIYTWNSFFPPSKATDEFLFYRLTNGVRHSTWDHSTEGFWLAADKFCTFLIPAVWVGGMDIFIRVICALFIFFFLAWLNLFLKRLKLSAVSCIFSFFKHQQSFHMFF